MAVGWVGESLRGQAPHSVSQDLVLLVSGGSTSRGFPSNKNSSSSGNYTVRRQPSKG